MDVWVRVPPCAPSVCCLLPSKQQTKQTPCPGGVIGSRAGFRFQCPSRRRGSTPLPGTKPLWRNGSRARLKSECPQGRVGSTPARGTNTGRSASWLTTPRPCIVVSMTPSLCLNRACRATLASTGRASNDQRYCPECGELVYAFRPDSQAPNDWFLVSDGSEPIEGNYVRGGQCEGCALGEYRVERRGRSTWEAVCRGQFVSGERVAGCGARHPIRMKMRHTVVL